MAIGSTESNTYYDKYKKVAAENKAKKDALAKQTYENTISSNKESAYTSKEETDILNQKLAKYLPNYMKAQGVTGGLSQSYANKVTNDVSNAYANVNKELVSSNTSALATYNNALAGNVDSYDSSMQTAEVNADTKSSNALSTYLSEIDKINANESLTSEEKKEKTENQWNYYKEYLGDYQKQAMDSTSDYLDSYDSDIKSAIDEDAKTIKIDNSTYNYSMKIDAGNSSAQGISSSIGVAKGDKQNDYVQAVLDGLGSTITAGSYINLNYGLRNGGNDIFYYDGTSLYKIKNPSSSQKDFAKSTLPIGYVYDGNDIRKIGNSVTREQGKSLGFNENPKVGETIKYNGSTFKYTNTNDTWKKIK